MPNTPSLPLRLLRLFLLIGMFAPFSTVRSAPNLVPEKSAEAANYWCTWYAQNYWQQRPGEITDFTQLNNPNAREELSDHHLFNSEDGWAESYLPRGREDFFFLIDHGWQTKVPSERPIEGSADFFSLQIDERDFPSIADLPPPVALRKFNERITALGWRGLGLWVRGQVTESAARTFVEWSREAGIEYWKIDGGDTEHFYSYQLPNRSCSLPCNSNTSTARDHSTSTGTIPIEVLTRPPSTSAKPSRQACCGFCNTPTYSEPTTWLRYCSQPSRCNA